MASTGRNCDQYMIRLPDGMRDLLKVTAKESGRSLNEEIVQRLMASFEPARNVYPEIARAIDRHIEAEVARRLQEIAAKIGRED